MPGNAPGEALFIISASTFRLTRPPILQILEIAHMANAVLHLYVMFLFLYPTLDAKIFCR